MTDEPKHLDDDGELNCDLAYLFSAPLWGNIDVKNPKMVIRSLDFQKEQKDLFETLALADRALRLKIEVATQDKFISLATMGIRALHFSGHGQEHMLAFEDGLGKVHCFTPKSILDLLSAGGQVRTIEFVFVSACNSELVGRAFAQAGVPHVIAVRRLEQLADESARTFMKSFYLGVLCRKTVKEAFEIAYQAVRTAAHGGDMNEPKKFLLLPEDGDHNKQIFRTIPKGRFHQLSEEETPNNLHSPVENFLGRNFEVQELVEKLADHGVTGRKLIYLTGPPKIGKTSLAVEGARYCLMRRMFEGGGVYMIDLAEAANPDFFAPTKSLAAWIAEELKIEHQDNWSPRMLAAHFRGKRMHLLILDNVDSLLNAKRNGPHCLKSLIAALMNVQIKLVVTSRTPMSDLPLHWPMEVKALQPQDSARLFYLSSPRSLDPSEYGARGVHDATKLGQHRALMLLAGNPGKLKFAAQKLTQEVKMEQLLEKIERELGEWETSCVFPEIDDPSLACPPPGRLVFPIENAELRAQASVLWNDMYGNAAEGPWDNLEQLLTERFRALSPARELDSQDLHELKGHFHLERTITIPAFCNFWPWWVGFEWCIGKVLDTWAAGGGMIQSLSCTRQQANQRLKRCSIGTFLLRPSLNNPGHLALGYVDEDEQVKQLLVDANGKGFKINLSDTGNRVYDTLPELIMKCRKLTHLYPKSDKERVFCAQEEDMPH